MPYKDPEAQKEYFRQYNFNRREASKIWRDGRKEERSKKAKEKYYTPEGHMKMIINGWKAKGVIHDDFEGLYEIYIKTENCDVCNNTFVNSKDRCLDHDHGTGVVRQILCQDCNRMDRWKNKLNKNILL